MRRFLLVCTSRPGLSSFIALSIKSDFIKKDELIYTKCNYVSYLDRPYYITVQFRHNKWFAIEYNCHYSTVYKHQTI